MSKRITIPREVVNTNGERISLPPDTVLVCGYGPFTLPLNHPFTPACNVHDADYEAWLKGQDVDLAKADKTLLHSFLDIAKGRITYVAEAYVFYFFVSCFRLLFRRKH